MAEFHFSFPCVREALEIAHEIFSLLIETCLDGCDKGHQLKLIASELFSNAYFHGNKANPNKYIDFTIKLNKKDFEMVVRDEGEGIDSARYSKLIVSESNCENESGRGLMIIDRLSDNVELFKDDKGKFCVRARKHLGGK